MKRTWHIPFGPGFIEHVCERFVPYREDRDYSDLRVVFPGRRPGLYLRRLLSQRHGGPFVPPRIGTMEDLVLDLMRGRIAGAALLSRLDEACLLEELLAGPGFEGVLRRSSADRTGFFRAYPWLEKIAEFIGRSESEQVPDRTLSDIGLHAELGFSVPEGLNRLLSDLGRLRTAYRALQEGRGAFSRGYLYSKVADLCAGGVRPEGKTVFAGLFGLTASEKRIIASIMEDDRCEVVWNGSPEDWSIIGRILKEWGADSIELPGDPVAEPSVALHAASSVMREAEDLRGLLEAGPDDAVVVLPRSESLLPVLSFGLPGGVTDDGFNISLDYPLRRTSLFNLLGLLKDAHTSSRRTSGDLQWNVRAYLAVLDHPFVRNTGFEGQPFRSTATKVHSLFEDDREGLFGRTYAGCAEIEAGLPETDAAILRVMHALLFIGPASALTLRDLSFSVETILRAIASRTGVRGYVLSSEIFRLFFTELESLRAGPAADRGVPSGDSGVLWSFFAGQMSALSLHFDTRPLKSIEILGMLETRALDFPRVYVLDTEEGVLPASRTVDPLVPWDLARFLGMPSPEDREEMYRYYFFRLVRSAAEVHLFYREASDVRRSRYVEEIVWQAEKKTGRLGVMEPVRSARSVVLDRAGPGELGVAKSDSAMAVLRSRVWSVTSLDSWLFCGIRFYYEYLLRLEMPEDFTTRLDPAERGTILHGILEDVFGRFLGRPLGRGRSKDEVFAVFDGAFDKAFADRLVSGEHYLFREIARIKLGEFLARQLDDPRGFRIIGQEQRLAGEICGMKFKGRLDRLDELEEPDEGGSRLRILDYKSGELSGKFGYDQSLASLTAPRTAEIRERIGSFQAVLYARLFGQTRPDLAGLGRAEAVLVSLKNPGETLSLSSGPKRGAEVDPDALRAYYDRLLEAVLAEILDPSVPFRKHDDDTDCPECPYFKVCRYK